MHTWGSINGRALNECIWFHLQEQKHRFTIAAWLQPNKQPNTGWNSHGGRSESFDSEEIVGYRIGSHQAGTTAQLLSQPAHIHLSNTMSDWQMLFLYFRYPKVPMNLLIMYMSGNSISIFPIMMVGMMLIRPIKAIIATQATFKVIEGTKTTAQKLIFFLGNLANVALAVYKCHSMGLLPTHASDWLAFVEPQMRLEYSGGGINFL